MIKVPALAALCLLGLAAPATAYIDASPTLGRVTREATNVVVLRVEKVSKDKRVIIYSKVEDLKGKHPGGEIKHQVTEGWHPGEAKLILDWAEPGQVAICFHNGKTSLTCIGSYWYGAAAGQSPWWTMTSGEARLGYAYFGSAEKLRGHLKALLEGKEVVITVVQFHEDRQRVLKQRDIADFKNVFRGRDCPVGRVKASLKMPDHPGEVKPLGPGAGGPEDVPPLVEALKGQDGHVRAGAAEELGLFGPVARDAMPALLQALEDPDAMVRVKAADAVARIDPANPAAVPALIKGLGDKSGAVRRLAAEALGGIGPEAKAAVPALVSALGGDNDAGVRWAAADALRDIGREAKAAIPSLEAALKDQKPEVRRAAAWSLLQVDPGNDERTTAAVLVLIAGLEDHYLTLELLRRVSLVYNKTAGVYALTTLLKRESVHTRWMAARILGENGPGARAAVPALVEALRDKERPPRVWSAISLAAIGPDAKAAVPALTEASKSDEFDQVRWLAAAARVRIASDETAAPLLIEALNGPKLIDDYRDVRRRAAESLGQLGPAAKAAVPALTEALKDKYPDIRAAAATSLGQVGPDAKPAIPALTSALGETDEGIRTAVAEAIKRIEQQ